MHVRPPSLFTRLRRHRGAWVLALAVLLFKVTMATFCVLDGPGPTVPLIGDVASVSLDDDGDTCVLDEGKGCHCSCAHTVALPSTFASPMAALRLSSPPSGMPVEPQPHVSRSPLRPPIA